MARRFWAFTLAETLIVMGIIGVVAALTVPNLNASTGEKEKVAKLQKIYRDLSDAYGRAAAVYGPIKEWGLTFNEASEDKFLQRLTDFLKYSKYCKNSSGCWWNGPDTGVILPDGAAIVISVVDSDGFTTTGSYPDLKDYGYISVDIDGPTKGKNLLGHDIFEFEIKDSAVMPNATDGLTGTSPAMRMGEEYYATAWVIQNGNMDYLKTDSSWKCPDGKTILNWTTNTTCK